MPFKVIAKVSNKVVIGRILDKCGELVKINCKVRDHEVLLQLEV